MKPNCIHLMILMMANNLTKLVWQDFTCIYGAEHLNMTIPEVGGI